MQTTLRSAFITDLLLPPPNSLPSLTPTQISRIGYDTALALLLDPESFIRLNPLVTQIRPLTSPTDSKHFVDVEHFCREFGIDPKADPSRGIGAEWRQFEITDKLNWGLGSSNIVYGTAMRGIPGGFESVTNPGSGVRIYGRFEILRSGELGGRNEMGTNSLVGQPRLERGAGADDEEEEEGEGRGNGMDSAGGKRRDGTGEHTDGDGVIHYIEHNETRCNALLGVYIKATNAKSHREMHEGFKRRWGEEVKRRLQEEAEKGKGGGAGTGTGTSRPGSAGVVLGERKKGSAMGAGLRKVDGDGGKTGGQVR